MKSKIMFCIFIASTCLFANSIFRVNLDGTGIEEVIVGLNVSSTLDIDEVDGKIYWIENDPPKIRRADIDGTNIEDLVTVGLNVPRGIDVDEVGRKLYWTDRSADLIQRSELDGSNVVTILSGVDRVQGIEVEPVDGKIYWSQDGITHPGYICRANLDGTGLETLVSDNMDPEDVAVDKDGGKIYWTENRFNFIQCSNLDGSNVETIVTGLDICGSIDVDAAGGKIYWTNRGVFNIIQRANLDGSNVEVLIADFSQLRGLALDIPTQKLYWAGIEDSSFIVDFIADITLGNAPLTVNFTDLSLGNPTIWEWDFNNDGIAESYEQNPTFTYISPSLYSVALTVSYGTYEDTEVKENYITVLEGPQADFSAVPLIGESPLEVSFTDLSTGDIVLWMWDFNNDGFIDSNEQNPIHTYYEVGLYTVSLRVMDNITESVEIKEDYIEVTGAGITSDIIPLKTMLYNNYPDPFNPTTTINYSLKENSKVELKIYNIKGQLIKTLVNEFKHSGEHSIIWDGRDSNGNRVGSGIYFYKLRAGDFQKVRKMVLLR